MKVTTEVTVDIDTNAFRDYAETDGLTASEVRELVRREVRLIIDERFREEGLLRNSLPRQSDTSREPSDTD